MGDLFSKFTYHNWNGSSVVDYMMSTKNYLVNNIIQFSVGNYLTWLSNHCLIKTCILCDIDLQIKTDEAEGEEIHPGFVWNDFSINKFKENLKRLNNEVKFKAWLNTPNPDPRVLAKNIRLTLWDNALSSGLKQKNSAPGGKVSEPWFDKECVSNKEKVSRLAKKL